MVMNDRQGWTWGVAYELKGECALQYLEQREVSLGGYCTTVTTFHPRDPGHTPFPVLLYLATAASSEWAGQAPLHEIASQVIQSSGPSGHNVEYVLRLAEFMRLHVPEGYDEHLATLETLVRLRIKENNMCLNTLMGEGGNHHHHHNDLNNQQQQQEQQQQDQEPIERRDTFQFSTNLPPKKLRCLNV
ncbi:hypothetical protein Pcinc_038731 [Petrolisthes cinctipes]|uniref:Gamma-glutamylcyclotransferase n=1 Tax=Petrolisthes cinctipes TaxID=88211 RepID=A0AAE1BPV6_PETCI|nr:hypothetical protein Pcinc_038731 [Petrolisthes cinctipes]